MTELPDLDLDETKELQAALKTTVALLNLMMEHDLSVRQGEFALSLALAMLIDQNTEEADVDEQISHIAEQLTKLMVGARMINRDLANWAADHA